MHLNEAQKEIVRKHLAIIREHPCPICSKSHFAASSIVFRLPEIQGGASYPVVAVTCQNCGYLMLFSAMQLGVFDSDTKAKRSDNNG